MKFSDLVARLAIGLDEEVGDFAESFRVLRLTVPGADDGRVFEWAGGVRLKTLFRTKYGPGGGVEVNPATVGFLLTALLLECSRREMAERAMDIQFALPPMTICGKRRFRMICPKTGQTYFGAALAKCLSDRVLFDDLMEVLVCTRLGMASLLFRNDLDDWRATRIAGTGSPMFWSERAKTSVEDVGIQRTATLKMHKVRFLFDAINQPEEVAAAG
jgi:hypothetical protein